jgi:predicted nuclease with TOPRIM domain
MKEEEWEKELKEYTEQIEGVNKKLEEIDAAKARVLNTGRRLEGIVAYIRNKLDELAKSEQVGEAAEMGRLAGEEAAGDDAAEDAASAESSEADDSRKEQSEPAAAE